MKVSNGFSCVIFSVLISCLHISATPSENISSANKSAETETYWVTETKASDLINLSLLCSGPVLYDETSQFQHVQVFKTKQYGNMLVIDDVIMNTLGDESHYSEMITHVPAFTHPNPKTALIIGGGDGGAARELLRHKNLEKIVMVEIDAKVIDACKQFLPSLAAALKEPLDHRFELKIDDGIKYLKDCNDNQFDIIIVDSTDPFGPGEGLFGEAFYRDCYRCLTKDGILVTQSESPITNTKVFKEIYDCYSRIFGKEKVFSYLWFAPTYPGGMWSFSYSAKGSSDPLKIDKEKINKFASENGLNYYNAKIHKAAFALPNFVSDLLKA